MSHPNNMQLGRLLRRDVDMWVRKHHIRYSGLIYQAWIDVIALHIPAPVLSDYRVDIHLMNDAGPPIVSREHFKECRAGHQCYYLVWQATMHFFFGNVDDIMLRFQALQILMR